MSNVDPFSLKYMKLKKWIGEEQLLSKEQLKGCFSQAAMLRALVDADAYEMSLEQMEQLDQLEAQDETMATPAKKDNMNAAWDEIKTSQHFSPAESLDPNTPARDGFVRFVVISDTHNGHERMAPLPAGDCLLHCGDFSMGGKTAEVESFNEWFGSHPHPIKILIAGNHELSFDSPSKKRDLIQALSSCQYVEDAIVELPGGLSLYGSPWTPHCGRWAFQKARGAGMLQKWKQIPSGVDIVMTHGPPLGRHDGSILGSRAGCLDLLRQIQERVKPKFHLFGHIHESYGASSDGSTTFVNAASMDCKHEPSHAPFVFELPVKDTAAVGSVAEHASSSNAVDASSSDDLDAMRKELAGVNGQLALLKNPQSAPHSISNCEGTTAALQADTELTNNNNTTITEPVETSRTVEDVAAAGEMAAVKYELLGPQGDSLTTYADEIVDGIWLGGEDAAADAEALEAHGVTHILVPAYTGHPHTPPPLHEGRFIYKIWGVMDLPGYPIIQAFPAFVAAIEVALSQGGVVLVHCASGVSRSTAIVAAFLMKIHKDWSATATFDFIQHRRPGISRKKFFEQLELWRELEYAFPAQGDESGPAKKFRRSYSEKRLQARTRACARGTVQTDWPRAASE